MRRETRARRQAAAAAVPDQAAGTVISLSADKGAAFWQLRARVADVQRAERAAQAAISAVERARGLLNQQVADLASEHGFAPEGMQFRLDDDTLTLTLTPDATAQGPRS